MNYQLTNECVYINKPICIILRIQIRMPTHKRSILLLLLLADLAALLKTINVKQMKNAKLNQKATAPAA